MEKEPDIMEVTGKNNKVILTTEGVFLNSKVLFIEYEDVIKSPLFIFLYYGRNGTLKDIFDFSDLEDKDFEEWYKEYLHRDYKNIFLSLDIKEDFYEENFETEEGAKAFCNDLYRTIYKDGLTETNNGWLNFDKILSLLLQGRGKTDLVERVYIWHPVESEVIKKEVEKRYGSSVKFVTGDFSEVIKENEIPYDSTFVFSDSYHIMELEELGILDYSSIVLAEEYWYNYDEDFEPIINIEELLQDHVFKIDFFNNITETEPDE